jgi:hypothetical protein
MPNDVKAAVSALALIVAAVLAYWSGSPIRPEFSTYVMVTAVFMVVAMWIFPEAGVRKATRAKLRAPDNFTGRLAWNGHRKRAWQARQPISDIEVKAGHA